ncbi:MAG: hypothetical protein WC596_01955 [Candidatus Shapirobacteria bacterium]
MELGEFRKKNKIELSEKTRLMWGKAMVVATKNKDGVHGPEHMERILASLDELLKSEKGLREKIDFEVLLTAIGWHDCWKSKRNPTNVFSFLFDMFHEGRASAKIFGRIAKRNGLEKKTISKIKYAIRKHSAFQLKKHKTIEAKILWDLDSLDIWSWERVEALKEKYLAGVASKKTQKMIRVGIFYFEKIMMSWEEKKKFYFRWTKKRLAEKKKIFLEKLKEEIRQIKK